MRALKLVQHLRADADSMSQRLLENIRNSTRCSELLRRVPVEEHKRYALDIYRDLMEWLVTETDSPIEARYLELGRLRAQQGVPFSQLFWAVCITREYLSDYIQQECLIDEPVEFWGGVMLLRSLNQFFDRALYFSLIGHQKADAHEFVRFACRLTEEVMAPMRVAVHTRHDESQMLRIWMIKTKASTDRLSSSLIEVLSSERGWFLLQIEDRAVAALPCDCIS